MSRNEKLEQVRAAKKAAKERCEQWFEAAKELIGDRATLTLFNNESGSTGIRISGCFARDATHIGQEIEKLLFPFHDLPDDFHERRLGFYQSAGSAIVWID